MSYYLWLAVLSPWLFKIKSNSKTLKFVVQPTVDRARRNSLKLSNESFCTTTILFLRRSNVIAMPFEEAVITTSSVVCHVNNNNKSMATTEKCQIYTAAAAVVSLSAGCFADKFDICCCSAPTTMRSFNELWCLTYMTCNVLGAFFFGPSNKIYDWNIPLCVLK